MTDPCVVQSFWFGRSLPVLQVLSLRSFLAHGHQFHLYTYDPIENVPDGVRTLDAAAILPRDSVFFYKSGFGQGSPSAFSNLFRYKLLHDRGGWWVDTDVVCLRPFDFAAEFVFASERHPDGSVAAASCVLKSSPGAAWVRHCLDIAQRRDKDTLIWGEIGPKLVHDAIVQHDLTRYLVEPDVFNPIDYWAFRAVQAAEAQLPGLEKASAIHLWNQKWLTNGMNPDFDGAPDSIYARIRREHLRPDERADASTDAALRAHIAFQEACLDRVARERDALHAAADASAREIAALREAIEGMRGSLSWRLTAPLRRMFDAVRPGARSTPQDS